MWSLLLACRVPPPAPEPPAPFVPDPVEVLSSHAVDCGLTTDLETVHFLEGDTVRFTVACTAMASATLAAAVLPAGASFDPGTGVYTWSTGPADAGRVDQVFQVHAGDGVGTAVVTFWVADDPAAVDNVPVDPLRYTEEWGLPVLHLATWSPPTTTQAEATVVWDGATYPALVKVHGRTSSHYPKQSYALEFDGAELPILPWGVSRDHFFLISTFDDNSYVRQKLTYDLWAATAATVGLPRLTPRSLFVVLYLDGAYHGLYLGLDRIDDEFADHMGFARDANLYKAVDPAANFYLTEVDGTPKKTLHDGYEKIEGEPADDFSDLDALVEFTGNATTEELLAEGDAWFDREEFVDWFLMVHYVNAEDSTNKNVYLHHAAGELFRYAPWDFNSSWGQNWRTYRRDPDVANYYAETNRIFAAFLEDPDSAAAVWARLDSLRADGPFAVSWQRAWLDSTFAAIDRSAQRDWDRWEDDYRGYAEWASYRDEHADWTDYEGEKAYVYQWIEDRAAWFEEGSDPTH